MCRCFNVGVKSDLLRSDVLSARRNSLSQILGRTVCPRCIYKSYNFTYFYTFLYINRNGYYAPTFKSSCRVYDYYLSEEIFN